MRFVAEEQTSNDAITCLRHVKAFFTTRTFDVFFLKSVVHNS